MRSDVRFLIAHLEANPDGGWTVRSPAVGIWIDPPYEAAVVGSSTAVGALVRLGRRIEVRLPATPSATVARAPRRRRIAVGYLDVLFQLVPIEEARGVEARTTGSASAGKTGAPDAAGWAIVAPTEGVFYSRLEPGAAPFVEVGSRVRIGQAIGLVEVMKTFNQIVHGGPGAPDEGEVSEIRVADGEEVKAGQTLVVLRG